MLATGLNITQQHLVRNLPNLIDKATVTFFFYAHVMPLVKDFVLKVNSDPVQLDSALLTFNARPDDIWGGRAHIKFKSARVFFYHAPKILAIARADNGRGLALVLGTNEMGAQSIIFKVFLPILWFLLLLNNFIRSG